FGGFQIGRFWRQIVPRVYGPVVESKLIVEMRARRTACRSDLAKRLAAGDRVTNFDLDLRHMAVTGRKAISMVDLYHIAIAASPPRLGHDTVSRSNDLLTTLAVDIHAGMEFIGTAAKRITPETKFIIYLTQMGPHRWNIRGIGGIGNSLK